jgi:hypothetical protein
MVIGLVTTEQVIKAKEQAHIWIFCIGLTVIYLPSIPTPISAATYEPGKHNALLRSVKMCSNQPAVKYCHKAIAFSYMYVHNNN